MKVNNIFKSIWWFCRWRESHMAGCRVHTWTSEMCSWWRSIIRPNVTSTCILLLAPSVACVDNSVDLANQDRPLIRFPALPQLIHSLSATAVWILNYWQHYCIISRCYDVSFFLFLFLFKWKENGRYIYYLNWTNGPVRITWLWPEITKKLPTWTTNHGVTNYAMVSGGVSALEACWKDQQ